MQAAALDHTAPATPATPVSPGGVLARVQRVLDVVNAVFAAVGLVVVVLFCFGQAADRYTVKSSFDAHDQLAKMGLVWMVFCGMALAYSARENLRIDLFSRRLPPSVLRLREILFEALTLAVLVILHVKAWSVVEVAAMQPIMGTPFTTAWSWSAILLGTASLAVTCLLRLVALARGTHPPVGGHH
jgi:TRAP-type C4-dicarboxylate transport system permease small subunit